MKTIELFTTSAIEDVVEEYCAAVQSGQADALRRICLPSTTFIGYTPDGWLTKQSVGEFAEEVARNGSALLSGFQDMYQVVSIDYLDQDVAIAKLRNESDLFCYEEILSLNMSNGKWRIAGRIISDIQPRSDVIDREARHASAQAV